MQLIDDIKKSFGFTDDKDVARILKRGKSTISKWRAAGRIPAQAEKEMREILLSRGQSPQSETKEPPLSLHHEMLIKLYDAVDAETQDEVLRILVKRSRKS